MTGLDPDYGSTPLDFDELDALLPEVAEAIGDPVSKAAVYELEQAYEDEVREAFVLRAAAGELLLEELLADWTLRDLHARLYENVWTWAGTYRQRELSIGIDPALIAVELRITLDNLRYRWELTSSCSPLPLTTSPRRCSTGTWTRASTSRRCAGSTRPATLPSLPTWSTSSSSTPTERRSGLGRKRPPLLRSASRGRCRAERSSFQTTTVSPRRAEASIAARPDRSLVVPFGDRLRSVPVGALWEVSQ